MKLIRSLDDERLELVCNDPQVNSACREELFLDSLRAALEERDTNKTNVDILVESCENVINERNNLVVETAAQKAVINGLHELVDRYVDERDAALSRVKQLEEAVEWAKTQEHAYPALVGELLRRAGKEGGSTD